jgi:histidinol phosphatase-like PHP family hydrolase
MYRNQRSIGIFPVEQSLDVALNEQDSAISALARQFADYLRGQTGITVTILEDASREYLEAELKKLDLALGQIADLAEIYGADQRADIEPLTVPAATLAGELLRAATGAAWMEPAFEGDLNLMMIIPDGPVIDLEGLARTALLSRQPALGPLMMKLLE